MTQPDSSKSLFLTNSRSGYLKKARQLAEQVGTIYGKAKLVAVVEEIDFSQLDKQLEIAIQKGYTHIFAAGGDGTVNAIGSRLIGKSVNFGVIPTGSGNGFARNLGFSTQTKLAVRQTLHAQIIKVDTASVNQQPFLNIAGLGLDAEVAQLYARTTVRGFFPYVKNTMKGWAILKGDSYEISFEGKRQSFDQLLGIIVANGSQWGYDAKAAASARLTDGLLDIVVLHRFPWYQIPLMARRMFRGKLERSRYVQHFRAKEVSISRTRFGPVQLDGEPFEAGKELHFKACPASLRLLIPNTLTPQKVHQL
ncbi:MAG: diacylglycerol kinase family protein [Bacteroidota bacterium]